MHTPLTRPFLSFLAVIVAALTVVRPQAQTPSPQATDALPVRRVVLYKSGVGYFEHVGRVRGNQNVTIDFTSGQLDDVLKSITALDLTGGRVSSVQYNTNESLERRLGALSLPLDGRPSRMQFLSALRGARIEVGSGAARVTGRLLSVDSQTRTINGAATSVEIVSVVSDAGEMQTIALEPGVNVRILDRNLSEEVSKYLSVMASSRERDVRRLAIAASGTGDRDLFVSYVSEVPVWKSTYRLVVPDAGDTRKPLLQGWAIVDNTIGEDWSNVQLSLVAGAPQAFIQAISRPYYVTRPVVPLPDRFLLNPQTHGSAVNTDEGGIGGTVTDRNQGGIPGVTVALSQNGRVVNRLVTGASGQYQFAGLTPGAYEMSFSIQGFKTARTAIAVQQGAVAITNIQMEVGQVTETVSVSGGTEIMRTDSPTVTQTMSGGFIQTLPRSDRLPPPAYAAAPPPSAAAVKQARQSQMSDADAAALGDLFEYKMKEPITIRRGQSALVPILSSDITAEKVSLWNPRMDSRRALRAFWITNSTGLTLDGGSFSIVEGQAFAGEGLMDPIKAGEKRLLSYAVDLGLTLDTTNELSPTRVTKVTVAKGILTQSYEHRRRWTFTARNQDSERKTLIIEHPKLDGWSLVGDTKPAESSAEWHRFRLVIEPKTTTSLVVEEMNPGGTVVRLADISDQQIEFLIKERALTTELMATLRDVQAKKAEVARLTTEQTKRRGEIDQIARDQERVRENMKSLKGSAEEKQLLQRYVRQLDEQENKIDQLRGEMRALAAQLEKARDDLTAAIEAVR